MILSWIGRLADTNDRGNSARPRHHNDRVDPSNPRQRGLNATMWLTREKDRGWASSSNTNKFTEVNEFVMACNIWTSRQDQRSPQTAHYGPHRSSGGRAGGNRVPNSQEVTTVEGCDGMPNTMAEQC